MRIPGAIKTGPAIILWLLACMFFTPQGAMGQSTCAQQVAEIKAYCRKIDQFIKTNPNSRRAFASNSSSVERVPEDWHEIRTDGDNRMEEARDNLDENASVWFSQGRIVGANFTLRRESRDWIQSAMYYYREDGTLARINAELKMFHGEMTFIREQFYDRKGVLIAGSTKSCSLKTGRAKKPDNDFIPNPLPVYETTDRLPFYQAKRISNVEFRNSNLGNLEYAACNSKFENSNFAIPSPLTLLLPFHIISGLGAYS